MRIGGVGEHTRMFWPARDPLKKVNEDYKISESELENKSHSEVVKIS